MRYMPIYTVTQDGVSRGYFRKKKNAERYAFLLRESLDGSRYYGHKCEPNCVIVSTYKQTLSFYDDSMDYWERCFGESKKARELWAERFK